MCGKYSEKDSFIDQNKDGKMSKRKENELCELWY